MIDEAYENFCKLVQSEMKDGLKHKVIKYRSDHYQKKMRKTKPWWNDDLTTQWESLCKAEKDWLKAPVGSKSQMKATMKQIQRSFNREVQKCKRNHWYNQQLDLMNICQENQPEFWKKIGKIGIGKDRKRDIPLEVIQDDGSVSNDVDSVKLKWLNAFKALLNPSTPADPENDEDIPKYPAPLNETGDGLNKDIVIEEVAQVLKNAKRGKAIGIDGLPVEVLKNKTCAQFMLHLFNACFKTGTMPDMWGKGIITPIVKDTSKELRDPGNHRGITIATAMYKLFCGILNGRLSKDMHENKYIVDNQNGFQKGRSTVDHLSTLTTIIESRKLMKMETFVAYIDFSKAYDRVNRQLLWKKLEAMGVTGRILQCIKGMYSNVSCKIKLRPDISTDWFKVATGLRQGCILSPLCFNAYINDMAVEIQSKCRGVKVGNERVSILMYADDVALMAENEQDLQHMLNILNGWCKKWDVCRALGLLISKA